MTIASKLSAFFAVLSLLCCIGFAIVAINTELPPVAALSFLFFLGSAVGAVATVSIEFERGR